MNDEMLKYKYRNLYYRLSSIKTRVDALKNENNDIIKLASNTLKIDKNTIEKDSLKDLQNANTMISNSIASTMTSIRYYM